MDLLVAAEIFVPVVKTLLEAAAIERGIVNTTLGPTGRGQASKQRDNIRRFLGYGYVDADDALACAADRATFFATGVLGPDRLATIDVPVPVAIGGKARPHSLWATLAWFSPVLPGRKTYRSSRLKIVTPAELNALAVSPERWHPDENQSNRGTVSSRRWSGANAPVLTPNMTVPLVVQRDPDQGTAVDESIPFGVAVTICMPGEIGIYDEVRARVVPPVQARRGKRGAKLPPAERRPQAIGRPALWARCKGALPCPPTGHWASHAPRVVPFSTFSAQMTRFRHP